MKTTEGGKVPDGASQEFIDGPSEVGHYTPSITFSRGPKLSSDRHHGQAGGQTDYQPTRW